MKKKRKEEVRMSVGWRVTLEGVLLEKAKELCEKGRLKEAKRILLQAEALGENSPLVLSMLSYLMIKTSPIQPATALRLAKLAVTKEPKDPEILYWVKKTLESISIEN